MEGTTDQVVTAASTANSSEFLDSNFRYMLFSVVYSIFFIVGLLANVYVLFILQCLRDAKGMGEIGIYMTNLTIADLLFVCALPFWIGYYSRGGHWIYKDFLCGLTGSFFFINTYGTILFLGAISLNRYCAVTQPLNMTAWNHRRRGIIVCVLIWLCTVSMAIPHLTSEGTHTDKDNLTRCFEGYHNETDTEKRKVAVTHFLIIGLFFVVFFLVMVCNLLIVQALLSQKPPQTELRSETLISKKSNKTLSSSGRRQRGVKQRALQMLLAVVGVFLLCFLPHHVVQAPWVLAVLKIKEGWGHVDWNQNTLQTLNDAHQITLVLMGLNCILDPVIYYFATKKFRRFIMAHLKKVVKGEGCSNTLNIQNSVESRNHSQRLHSVQLQPTLEQPNQS
ncbi:platelet-activating factor receptor [Oryzias latipes]|uniref:Platelet-activating factor receptor n=1 Tax=Oryzias latipes TaxID=8090 RepID=H2MB30_ORYLA|nr:platelet-activating factor receptor [Oryzias latipes]